MRHDSESMTVGHDCESMTMVHDSESMTVGYDCESMTVGLEKQKVGNHWIRKPFKIIIKMYTITI